MLLFSEIWFCCFPNNSFLLCWLWGSLLLRNWWVYCRGVRICAERYCFCDMLGEPPPRLKPLDEKRQTKRKQTELLQDSTKGTSCQQMFSTSLETCSPGPPDKGVNQAIVSPNGKMIGRIPVRISCFYITIVCCMLNVFRICLPLSAFTIPSICHINGSLPLPDFKMVKVP